MLAYMRLDAQIYRYEFDLATGQTTERVLDDQNMEFPSIDSRIVGQNHRYSYNMRLANVPTLAFDGIVKFDSSTGQKLTHEFGAGRYGSEAPFAARDNSKGETDGYLVTFVTDEIEGTSEILIIAADDIEAAPVARVKLPQRVPSGFHATWVRADQLR